MGWASHRLALSAKHNLPQNEKRPCPLRGERTAKRSEAGEVTCTFLSWMFLEFHRCVTIGILAIQFILWSES